MYYLYFKTKKYVYCTILIGNILYLYGIFIFMEYKILNFEYWYIKKKCIPSLLQILNIFQVENHLNIRQCTNNFSITKVYLHWTRRVTGRERPIPRSLLHWHVYRPEWRRPTFLMTNVPALKRTTLMSELMLMLPLLLPFCKIG